MMAGCLLAGCANEAQDDQPLSPSMIRSRFSGRTFNGSENGNRFLLSFEPNGIATMRGPTAEYGRWRPDENGLCLSWYARPEQCAPVYQVGFARYRVGDADLNSQETFTEPAFDQSFDPDFERRRDQLPTGFGRSPFGAFPR
jgi:hypothetical protein